MQERRQVCASKQRTSLRLQTHSDGFRLKRPPGWIITSVYLSCAHFYVDTGYVRTYSVLMNITLSIDDQLVENAREKLRAVGKSLNQEIREHLQHLAGDDHGQLERDLEFLHRTAGRGNSNGWKYNRDDAYEERLKWPRI